MIDRLLDVLYPRVCGACGAGSKDPLCDGCESRVDWIGSHSCPSCGAARTLEFCSSCAGRKFAFRRAVALGAYQGALREIVLSFKFKAERSLAQPLARRLAERIRSAGWRPETIAFVPMSRWKQVWTRRSNAAELLAERLSRELSLPLFRGLRKTRRTRPQTDLPLAERLAHPRDAYRCGTGVSDKAVLLVDDVLTTGATASACAQALYAARAREVSVAVVARSLNR